MAATYKLTLLDLAGNSQGSGGCLALRNALYRGPPQTATVYHSNNNQRCDSGIGRNLLQHKASYISLIYFYVNSARVDDNVKNVTGRWLPGEERRELGGSG